MIAKEKEELRRTFKEHIAYLHKQILVLQNAVKELKKTGLREDILAYIIQQSAKQFHTGTPIKIKFIKFILQGMEEIDEYLFPNEKRDE